MGVVTEYKGDGVSVRLEDMSGEFMDEMAKQMRGMMRGVGDRAVMEARANCKESEEIRKVYRGRELEGADAQHLRDTIMYGIAKTGNVELRLNVGATKFTAHFVELGTVKFPPAPFINPAMRKATADIEYLMVTAAEKIRLRGVE